VSHSHLALQHLINKIDSAGPRQKRSSGPDWLAAFVDQVAELFEPFIDVGRVGYECVPQADRWDVSMYLGSTEAVGGKVDGEVRAVAFEFDILRLNSIFEQVDELRWSAFPAGTADRDANGNPGERSFVAVACRYQDAAVRLKVFCTPPTEVSPGLRHYADGTWEPV